MSTIAPTWKRRLDYSNPLKYVLCPSLLFRLKWLTPMWRSGLSEKESFHFMSSVFKQNTWRSQALEEFKARINIHWVKRLVMPTLSLVLRTIEHHATYLILFKTWQRIYQTTRSKMKAEIQSMVFIYLNNKWKDHHRHSGHSYQTHLLYPWWIEQGSFGYL